MLTCRMARSGAIMVHNGGHVTACVDRRGGGTLTFFSRLVSIREVEQATRDWVDNRNRPLDRGRYQKESW